MKIKFYSLLIFYFLLSVKSYGNFLNLYRNLFIFDKDCDINSSICAPNENNSNKSSSSQMSNKRSWRCAKEKVVENEGSLLLEEIWEENISKFESIFYTKKLFIVVRMNQYSFQKELSYAFMRIQLTDYVIFGAPLLCLGGALLYYIKTKNYI